MHIGAEHDAQQQPQHLPVTPGRFRRLRVGFGLPEAGPQHLAGGAVGQQQAPAVPPLLRDGRRHGLAHRAGELVVLPRLHPECRHLRVHSDSHLTCTYVFLREDRRRTDHAWDTTVFRYRRRALRKAELTSFLAVAGFADVAFLPQRGPWAPYEVVATKAVP